MHGSDRDVGGGEPKDTGQLAYAETKAEAVDVTKDKGLPSSGASSPQSLSDAPESLISATA